jgi:hypothetical protein
MNDSAIRQFLKCQADILEKLEYLTNHITNIQDYVSPDEVNWGNVGSLKHIEIELENIISFVKGE